MDSEGIERITRDYSDEELRLCAVREANGLRPEGKYPTMGFTTDKSNKPQ